MKLPRPRLATVLVLLTLVILLLPLGSIGVLRIYESALVRQTESELIAQGAVMASTYRAVVERLTRAGNGTGSSAASGTGKATARKPGFRLPPEYGNPVTSPPRPQDPENRWRPRFAVLDLASDPVLPAAPDPEPAAAPADPLARAAGAELTPILRDAQHVTLSGMRITDPAGVIVATTGADGGASLANHDEVRRALTGEYVSVMRWRGSNRPVAPPLDSISRGTRIRVFVAVPIVHRERVIGSVLLLRTPGNIFQALYGKRRELMTGGLVLLAVVLAIAIATSLLIARPVAALRAQAHRAARGERGAVTPLRHPGTREIADLSETVADMAQTLEQRANYIRDFAAQISHEFKTPLTAMQGAVEVLREHGATMSDAERARFLDIVEADTRRLGALVKRLLELARADVMPAAPATTDLALAIAPTLQRFRESGLAIDVDVPAVRVALAPETAEAVFANLLDNVRVHAGAAARVNIAATISGSQVEVIVADDGPGVSAGNAARVFDPFFTTARDRGGTGLGLPIARALLRAHGGDVELLPAERGARLKLRLPVAAT